MRILTLAVAVMLLLVLWSGSLYASGFENTGLGTTARGMGGAFRAIADDWSAAYYNPAGYAYIVDNQLGIGWGLINFRDEVRPQYVAVDDFGNEYGWGIANLHAVIDSSSTSGNGSKGLLKSWWSQYRLLRTSLDNKWSGATRLKYWE